MTRRFCRRLALIILVIILSGITVSCSSFSPKDDLYVTKDGYNSYYTFDSDTILVELAQDNLNIFQEQSASFEPAPFIPRKVVRWSQDDYVRVATAFHEYFWNRSLDEWKLIIMGFFVECQDVGMGQQYMSFEFLRVTYSILETVKVKETINIDPSTNSLWFKTERLYSPHNQNSESIDLSKLVISSDDALKLAEANGGTDVRAEIGNDCGVTGILAPNGSIEGWDVGYLGKVPEGYLHVYIDQYSGEFQVIYP